MEFPQVDLPVDMIAWTEVTEDILNISLIPQHFDLTLFISS